MDKNRQWEIWDKQTVKRALKLWGGVDNTRGRHWSLLRKISDLIPEDVSVLEVAPGMGHLYYMIKDRVKSYLGLDTSVDMVNQFHEFFPDADVRIGDAFHLEEEPSVEVVVNVDMLMHIPGELAVIEYLIKQMYDKAEKKLIFTLRMTDGDSRYTSRKIRPDSDKRVTYRAVSYDDFYKLMLRLHIYNIIEVVHDSRTSIWVVTK